MLTYQFDRENHLPVYEQLYRFIRDDILSGKIPGDTRLPSKREFASHLGISKVTVENAYALLISEGYVYSLAKKGYFAEKDLSVPGVKYTGNLLSDNSEDKYSIDLCSNMVPPHQFPFSVWTRLMKKICLDYSDELLTPIPYNGTLYLRSVLCRYLFENKGMDVRPSQIVIGAGSEILYSNIIRALGDDVSLGIEYPTYHKTINIYRQNLDDITFLPLNDEGIIMEYLNNSGCNVIHFSPSHNFPTGTITSARRRAEILKWANEKDNRFIIEDDFDSELRFSGKPMLPVYSSDAGGKVIYINTFSKTIAPSVRIGYMVLPVSLAERYGKMFSGNSCTVSSFEQYTLADFINDGYFERHLNRTRKYYRELRSVLLSKAAEFGMFSITENDAGLHFVLGFDTDKDDAYISSELRKKGINSMFMSDYGAGEKNNHKLLINYSGLNVASFETFLSELDYILQNGED